MQITALWSKKGCVLWELHCFLCAFCSKSTKHSAKRTNHNGKFWCWKISVWQNCNPHAVFMMIFYKGVIIRPMKKFHSQRSFLKKGLIFSEELYIIVEQLKILQPPIIIWPHVELSEWPKEQHWKCCVPFWYRGFKSLTLRQHLKFPDFGLSKPLSGFFFYFQYCSISFLFIILFII